MVTPSAGSIVTVPIPFSDLSSSKLRPAVVLAYAGQEDWILCQITSNVYADAHAIQLEDDDFASGSLSRISFARPGKIFTAHESLMVMHVGRLDNEVLRRISNAVIEMLRADLPL